MSARAHAALWLAAIAVAWMSCGMGTDVALETARAATRTPLADLVGALLDIQGARVRSNVLHAGVALRVWWQFAPVWLPVVIAGGVDGMAARRARRCGLEAAPDLGRRLGGHALVALGFAPVLWASVAAAFAALTAFAPLVVSAWAIALSVALSFTLSRVQGLNLRG